MGEMEKSQYNIFSVLHEGRSVQEMNETLEDIMITKIGIEERIRKFDPEIQKIFYDSYGEKLGALPRELLQPGCQTEELLEQLLKLGSVNAQKAVLMRFGIVTGTPMTLEAVSAELDITRERVRQIENLFLRRFRPHLRRRMNLND